MACEVTPSRRALVASGLAGPIAAVAPGASRANEVVRLDATALAAAIRRGHITPLEAVDAAIARAEALQPTLNFLVTDDFERARDRAKAMTRERRRAPFLGVPFLIKDLKDFRGLPTRLGSRLAAHSPPAKDETPQVAAYERVGLNVIGKSATPEFGLLPTTEPVATGPTRNPWNPGYSTGGSSGGAAAAVAAWVTPFAHATDGGGSIRIPSSCCGLFGLKPSRGRLLSAGPPTPTIDLSVSHCVSLSVRDSAALFALTEDHAVFHEPVGLVHGPSRRRLRIGVILDGPGAKPDADVERQVRKTAGVLKGLGHHVRPAELPYSGEAYITDFLAVWARMAQGIRDQAKAAVGADKLEAVLEPFTLQAAAVADRTSGDAFAAALARLKQSQLKFEAWMADYDVVLTPVLQQAPPRIGWFDPTQPYAQMYERLQKYVFFTPALNAFGAPAMSVPSGLGDNGLPIGSHLFAKIGDEKTLFHLAYELEAAAPWRGASPAVHA